MSVSAEGRRGLLCCHRLLLRAEGLASCGCNRAQSTGSVGKLHSCWAPFATRTCCVDGADRGDSHERCGCDNHHETAFDIRSLRLLEIDVNGGYDYGNEEPFAGQRICIVRSCRGRCKFYGFLRRPGVPRCWVGGDSADQEMSTI